MLLSDIPTKISVPWARDADTDHKRDIPIDPTGETGSANWKNGFPDANFQAVGAGGVPPFGKDANGVINRLSAWARWITSGMPAKHDGSFVTAVGGYPRGAQVLSNQHDRVIQSLVDNNTADPNLLGSQWRVLVNLYSSESWVAGGSANVQTLTLSPTPASLASLAGVPITVLSVGTNTGAATLNINSFGNKAIQQPTGAALTANSLISGRYFTIAYVAAADAFQMLAFPPAPAYTPPFTPVQQGGGAFQFNNKVYMGWDGSQPRVQVDATDLGQIVMANRNNAITGANTFTQSPFTNGRMRQNLDAYGSGDPFACTRLNDFPISGNANGWWTRLPNGWFFAAGQAVFGGVPNMNLDPSGSFGAVTFITVVYPVSFPTATIAFTANGLDSGGWPEGSEMCVGVLAAGQGSAAVRINRTSGSNNSGAEVGSLMWMAVGV